MKYVHSAAEAVKHHECDAAGEMKLHCLLDRLQDAAAEHAAKLDVGMHELAAKQLIWVLSRLKISLLRPLVLGDDLEVRTFPCGTARIFAHRNFDLFSSGEKVGCAGSFWLPVNVTANRPVSAGKVLPPEIKEMQDVEKYFPDMDKLPENPFPICASRCIGAGDIDLNRHLNNAVYARWITDMLGDLSGRRSVRISEIQLNYINAGQYGEKIVFRAGVDDQGKFMVSGEKEDSSVFFQSVGKMEVGC